ncbi:MAG: 4Fe-4S binding protein [Planctomycetaceae bacterium]|nr:4Fe-4S binding protein [Planctomycetaceae bacterium]
MKRWLLKIAIFILLVFLLHAGTFSPSVLEGVRALSPFLFLANCVTGTLASLGILAILAGISILGLSIWKRRFFCRWICPVGFLQDILRSFRSRLVHFFHFSRSPRGFRLRVFQYAGQILALSTFGALVFGGFTFLWMDPLILLDGSRHVNWCRWFLGGIGIFALLFPRLWCFFLCPCGGVQEVLWNLIHRARKKEEALSSFSSSGISRPTPRTSGLPSEETGVESKSGTEIESKTDFAESEFSEAVLESENFPEAKVSSESKVFSGSEFSGEPESLWESGAGFLLPNRRQFFHAGGIFAFSAAGIIFLRQSMKVFLAKVSGAIPLFRPPGALPEEKFLARCSRCGACAGACPTKLLKTIDDVSDLRLFGTPTADFTPSTPEDRIFCDESCAKCGEVCPTGALRKFSLNEKRNVRLGKCEFDYSLCRRYYQMECSICLQSCPFEALDEVWSDEAYAKIPRVIAELCVGCGKCAAFCPGEPLIQWDAESSFVSDTENIESTGKKALRIVPFSDPRKKS